MFTAKPQQALSPAAARSARSTARLNTSLKAVAQPKSTHPSQTVTQQRSRSSWHRPGCSYAASVTSGAGKSAPRDHTCPACQQQETDPFNMTARDLMMQHKRQMTEMRSMFERNPYDALFGLSNRRLNALWDSHFSFPDIKSFFPARASVHSTSKAQASASPTRRVPVKDDSEDFRASVTWSTSGVSKDGKPFDKSGTLVYDPVTGKMVKTKEEVDHVSTTAAPATVVGKVVHQTIVEEGGAPEVKYARPSADPEEIPQDQISKAQQAKIKEIQALESKLEAAKEKADTAVGIEKDAREYNWNDPTAKDDIIPSGAPPRNINNELGRMVNLEFDEQGPAHKYVTPTADHPTGPPPAEKFSAAHKESMQDIMQREQELQKLKKSAESAVGVEEDAAAAGWTSDTKPSSVSTTQNHEPRTSNGYSAKPISNAQILDSGKLGRPTFSFSAESSTNNTSSTITTTPVSAMERIQAKEREYEERKRNLNTLKAKQHDMEQSWKREQAPRSTFTSDVRSTQQWPSPQELDRQARAREVKKDKASAWARFKNATPSKRYLLSEEGFVETSPVTAVEYDQPLLPRTTSRQTSIPSYQASDAIPEPTSPVERRIPSVNEGQAKNKAQRSTWRAAASSEEPAPGYMRDRTPGALSVFTKEKSPKSMSMSELNRDRANVMSHWKSVENAIPDSAAARKLDSEVEAQKSAMSWFENKWRLWNGSTKAGPTAAVKSADNTVPKAGKSNAEAVTAEGDMAPNVAEFAVSERWYKNKAPHAYGPEEQPATRDDELESIVRSVYERAYGSIDKGLPQSSAVETGKKPSVHATLKDLSEVEEPKDLPTLSGDYQLHAYTRRAEHDGEVVPMPAAKVKLLQLSRHLNNDAIGLPQALLSLRDPTPFAKFWSRNARPQEEIVFATRDILVTRSPKSTSDSASTLINHPLDPSNAAEHPAAPTTTDSPQKPPSSQIGQREVRREEPVFSGQLPAQRQSIPEIVNLLNAQGVAEPCGPARRGRAHERQQRRADRSFLRGLRKVVVIGGWLAGAAYATGVVVEYFRAGPSGSSDGGRGWEDRAVYRPQMFFGASKSQDKKPVEPQAVRRDGFFEDMPLRGMEYPLLGILAGCVWYLISNNPSA